MLHWLILFDYLAVFTWIACHVSRHHHFKYFPSVKKLCFLKTHLYLYTLYIFHTHTGNVLQDFYKILFRTYFT